MIHLIFFATGLFFNPTTGADAHVVNQVSSITECAQVIDDFLDNSGGVVETATGTFYLIKAECKVVEVK